MFDTILTAQDIWIATVGYALFVVVLGVLVGKFIHAGNCEAVDVREWLPPDPDPGPTVAEVIATHPATYNCTTSEALDLLQSTHFIPVDTYRAAEVDELAALLADPRCLHNLPLVQRAQ